MRESNVIKLLAVVLTAVLAGPVAAQPINPQVFKKRFEEAKKDAEVVADVQVLSAVCTELAGAGKAKSVTLQLSLLVLDAEKGPAKKNEVLLVAHKVNLPAGPGPGMYGYMGALRQFPFTPGVKGSVALGWDKDARKYTAIAGWVPEPNHAAIPKEVGQAFAWNDVSKLKIGMSREDVIKILGPPQKMDTAMQAGTFSMTYDNLVLGFRSDLLEEVSLRLPKK
jgi:hypothetical protein